MLVFIQQFYKQKKILKIYLIERISFLESFIKIRFINECASKNLAKIP